MSSYEFGITLTLPYQNVSTEKCLRHISPFTKGVIICTFCAISIDSYTSINIFYSIIMFNLFIVTCILSLSSVVTRVPLHS